MQKITSESFWQFSLNTYQQPKIQAELLTLQNDLGGNVNLALLCIYLDNLDVYITKQEIEQLHNKVISFTTSYTTKLRDLRKLLKANSESLLHYSKIKSHLLSAELLLERQEQEILLKQLTALKVQKSIANESNNHSNYLQILPVCNKLN